MQYAVNRADMTELTYLRKRTHGPEYSTTSTTIGTTTYETTSIYHRDTARPTTPRDNTSINISLVWLWMLVSLVVIIFLIRCCVWCVEQNNEDPPPRRPRAPRRMSTVAIIDSEAPQSIWHPHSTIATAPVLPTYHEQPPPYYQLSPGYQEDPPPPYCSLEMERISSPVVTLNTT